MKTALNDAGSPFEAGPDGPAQARCPTCGGVVILRRRQRSRRPGDVTYFWRHQDHTNLHCPERFTVGVRIGGSVLAS